MHLRYDIFQGRRIPSEEMQELGIAWQYLVGHSMADEVWFLNCTDVPDVLPEYITEIKNFNPHDHVGYGLSVEMAEEVAKEAARLNAKGAEL